MKEIAKYGIENRILTDKEMSILEIACNIPKRLPSELQSKILKDIEKRMIVEGFFYNLE